MLSGVVVEGAGDRIIPHVTRQDGAFSTQIVVSNSDMDGGTVSFQGYNPDGTKANLVIEIIEPLQTRRFDSAALFSEAVSHFVIVGEETLQVSVQYEARVNAVGPAHVHETSDVSLRWKVYPGDDGYTWDGVAVVNMGDQATDVLIKTVAEDGTILATWAPLPEILGPKAKGLIVLSDLVTEDAFSFYSIIADQPLAVTALRGTRDHRYLWENPALTFPELTNAAWTFLFYDDADFEDAYDPFFQFADEMTSGDGLNVVICRDREDQGAAYYRVEASGVTRRLESLGEVNMGDEATLAEFVRFGKQKYPARRTMLAFYNHGGGWMGACVDGTSGDMLCMREIESALAQNQGVDAVLFTAPCLMGALESAYQLKDVTDLYVGSENLSGYIFWNGTLSHLNTLLKNSPLMPTLEIGTQLIDFVETRAMDRPDSQPQLTMSAVDTAGLDGLRISVDELSNHFVSQIEVFRGWFDHASVQSYADFCVDLGDFVHHVQTMDPTSDVVRLVNQVETALEQCVVAETHGSAVAGSHGLSIYFPDPRSSIYNTQYHDPDVGLHFVRDTHWDELLTGYFGANKASIDPVLTMPFHWSASLETATGEVLP